MKKTAMMTLSLLALTTMPVLAETPKDAPNKMFARQDTNGDGAVTEAEFLDNAKKKFAEIDTNKDGKISKDESEAHRAAWKDKRGEKREDMKEKMKEKMEEKAVTTP